MSHSADYHDYVFKNGRLVGKFDDMYKYATSVPWRQDVAINDVFSDIDIAILRQHNYDSVCEVGCGLGYFTDRLYRDLSSKTGKDRPSVTGIDISRIAVDKAAKTFPHIHFLAADLIKEMPFQPGLFDLVVVKEVLWYVSHELDAFLRNVMAMVKEDGLIFISQSFPELEDWIGRDTIDSPDTLKSIISEHTDPLHFCVEWDWNYNGRPLVHILGKKRYGMKR